MATAARRQPQGLVRLNRSNALGRKVIEYLPLNGQARAIVSGAPITIGAGGSFQASPKGVGLRSGTGARASVPLNLSAYNKITLAFWMKWDAFADDDQFAMEFGSPTYATNPTAGFFIDPNASGTGSRFLVTAGTNVLNNNNGSSFTRPSAGVWHRYVIAIDTTVGAANSVVSYVDGVAQGLTQVYSASLAGANFQNGTLYLLSRSGTSLFGNGNIQDFTVYNGILTPQEAANDYANPWQILDAPSQTQFPMAAAAPAGVSGSITWTEASDSAAAAGSVKVSGAAAWTEAADSAALAGSVGSAVGINAAWTEAADSVAIASTARVNAAAAWTEAADSISMAGSAGNSVAANISWTEAADVTTVAGTIRINAAGSWTEAGDTAAIVVNVAAAQSAVLSWTEAPDGIAIAANVVAAPVVGTIAWTEQADIAVKATYPGFYSFTLMRADPISSAGAMNGTAQGATLMRSSPIASVSTMSNAPINQNVNLI